MENENLDDYQRDQLWQATNETYYKVYYAESLTNSLIKKWQFLDEIAKVVIALTAVTSAVSGWALWSQPRFKIAWSIFAGFGAVLAIVHTSLKVPDRLTDLSGMEQYLKGLRINLETFRYRMRLDPNFSVEEFKDEFLRYRERYLEGSQRLKNDILLTKRTRTRVERELNEELQDLISRPS
jgi:hypothetical protein